MAEKDKGLKLARKAFDLPEGEVQKNIGENGEVNPKGKRGRKKRVSGEGAESSPAKAKRRTKSDGGSQFVQGIGEEDLDMDDVEDD